MHIKYIGFIIARPISMSLLKKSEATYPIIVENIATDQVATPIPIQKSILFSFSIFS